MRVFLATVFTICVIGGVEAASPEAVAPNCTTLFEGESISLSRVERTWVCGDPDSRVWNHVPPNQRIFFLRNFLQERGYHEPTFRVDGDKLFVTVGPRSHVRKAELVGGRHGVDLDRRRRLIRQPLTPDLLDETESWLKGELANHGYPCSSVESAADPRAESVVFTVAAGKPRTFGVVEVEGKTESIALLERYFAFLPHWKFDARLLELSSRRMLRDDLFLSAYFDWACDPAYQLRQNLVVAKPRLLTFDLGVNTEVGVFGMVRWKHANLDELASSFQTSLSASLRAQELAAEMRKYINPKSPFHLIGTGKVRREDERRYETITYGVGGQPATAVELPFGRTQAAYGPFMEFTKTIDGQGPRSRRTLHWLGKVDFMSHGFEYFLGDPREGWAFLLDIDSQFKGKLAETTAHRIVAQGQALYNFLDYDPPLLVFGWRFKFGSFLLGRDRGRINEIPINQRFFLGGDADIRGFSRKSLPNDPRGFAVMLYNGFEIRAGHILPLNLQPLLFVDYATGGIQAGTKDEAVFWAPGAGVRYPSPIGTVRFTFARGFTIRSPSGDPARNDQFFVTLGQEL